MLRWVLPHPLEKLQLNPASSRATSSMNLYTHVADGICYSPDCTAAESPGARDLAESVRAVMDENAADGQEEARVQA